MSPKAAFFHGKGKKKKKKKKSGKKYFITSGSEVEVQRGADLRQETPFGFVNPSRHVWKTCNSACGPKEPPPQWSAGP